MPGAVATISTRLALTACKEDEGLFPLSLLAQAKRDYLVSIGRQMNGAMA